jgi:hypothetical protein
MASPAFAGDDDKDSGSIPRGTEKGTIGVGIIIGQPFGVSARLYLKDDQALQAAVGFAVIGGGLQLDADYVFHPYIVQTRPSFVLATYVGPGVRFLDYQAGRNDSYFAFGLRGVGGLLFDFKSPLDAFIEVAGVLEYGFQDGKGAGIAFDAALGVRYYF